MLSKMGTQQLYALRARPLTLHLRLQMHFYIRQANADTRKPPTHLRVIPSWMKSDAGSLELLAYMRDMQGGLLIIRQLFFVGRRTTFLWYQLVIYEPNEFEK